MFEDSLRQLVDDTGAELAIFCDYEGEAIAFAAPPSADPYDVRLTGAQLGGPICWAQEFAERTGQGDRLAVSIRTDQRQLLVQALPGRYYVVLQLPAGAMDSVARRKLAEVAALFGQEL